MKTVVIGHKNPDMDAICSAMAYAEFKSATGLADVVAARCGNTNERIDYGLRRFGFEPPLFLRDVFPRVEDVMERDVVCAHVNSPVYEAMARIGESKFRGLPVVDDSRRCVGLVSGFKLGEYLFPPLERIASTRVVEASLRDIRSAIHGQLIAGEDENILRPHQLVVAAMQTDSFAKRLTSFDLGKTVLLVGDRHNIQMMSIEAGVRALVITNYSTLGEDVLAAARAKGVTVIGSTYDTATTVLLARAAISAEKLLYSEFASVPPDMPLREARQEAALSSQFAFPVLAEDGTLVGILSKSDFLKPVPRQLILVDHNELAQAVKGANETRILEILDHHRIGVAPTSEPITFINRPVGSTCTIVATCYEQQGMPIPKAIAGLMMCGLISDTLNLTSPTTTEVDRSILARLSKIVGVQPTDLANEIFSVGSPLLTLSPKEAIEADCKEYNERGHRFSVSQIEELSFSHLAAQKEALSEALEKCRAANDYLFSVLLITDINTQNSILLLRGTDALVHLVDFPEDGAFSWKLDGIVSRKKQLLPYLLGLLARVS